MNERVLNSYTHPHMSYFGRIVVTLNHRMKREKDRLRTGWVEDKSQWRKEGKEEKDIIKAIRVYCWRITIPLGFCVTRNIELYHFHANFKQAIALARVIIVINPSIRVCRSDVYIIRPWRLHWYKLTAFGLIYVEQCETNPLHSVLFLCLTKPVRYKFHRVRRKFPLISKIKKDSWDSSSLKIYEIPSLYAYLHIAVRIMQPNSPSFLHSFTS